MTVYVAEYLVGSYRCQSALVIKSITGGVQRRRRDLMKSRQLIKTTAAASASLPSRDKPSFAVGLRLCLALFTQRRRQATHGRSSFTAFVLRSSFMMKAQEISAG